MGVKSLASWPIFVTAIYNEQAAERSAYAYERHQAERQVRDALTAQLPIFDFTTTANPTGTKARKRKVEKTLAEIRKLHEDLNACLYSHPTERPTIHSPQDAFDLLQPFLDRSTMKSCGWSIWTLATG